MTIITKVSPEKKLIKDDSDFMEVELPAEKVDERNAAPYPENIAAITIVRRKRYCLLLSLLVLTMVALLGVVYLYKYMAFARSPYRAVCGVKNVDYDYDNHAKVQFLREEIEMDLDQGLFSKIQMPDIPDAPNNHYSRVIHDFGLNLSVIVDVPKNRCFVMKLDRVNVKPPRSFYDMYVNTMRGDYEINAHYVQENYHVTREIVDKSSLGGYIGLECYFSTVYQLERDEPLKLAKREAVAGEEMNRNVLEFLYYDVDGYIHEVHIPMENIK